MMPMTWPVVDTWRRRRRRRIQEWKGFGLKILVLLFCIRVSPSCSACEGSSVQFARRERESELSSRLWILFYVAA
jgi:hypothetical protein